MHARMSWFCLSSYFSTHHDTLWGRIVSLAGTVRPPLLRRIRQPHVSGFHCDAAYDSHEREQVTMLL